MPEVSFHIAFSDNSLSRQVEITTGVKISPPRNIYSCRGLGKKFKKFSTKKSHGAEKESTSYPYTWQNPITYTNTLPIVYPNTMPSAQTRT